MLSQWTSPFVQNISMTIRHPLSLDPLSSDPLSLDPLSLDPLSLDPLSLDPLSLDPLSSDPLSLDPLSSDPLSLDPLSSDPHIVQGNTSRETPQFKGTWRNLRRAPEEGSLSQDGQTIDAVCKSKREYIYSVGRPNVWKCMFL